MAEKILDLSALAPKRQKARLPNGEVYELAGPEDFGAVQLSRVGQMIVETDELWTAKKLTVAQQKRLTSLLDKLAQALIPDAPAEAVAKLPAVTKRVLGLRFLEEGGESVRPLIREGSPLTSES